MHNQFDAMKNGVFHLTKGHFLSLISQGVSLGELKFMLQQFQEASTLALQASVEYTPPKQPHLGNSDPFPPFSLN